MSSSTGSPVLLVALLLGLVALSSPPGASGSHHHHRVEPFQHRHRHHREQRERWPRQRVDEDDNAVQNASLDEYPRVRDDEEIPRRLSRHEEKIQRRRDQRRPGHHHQHHQKAEVDVDDPRWHRVDEDESFGQQNRHRERFGTRRDFEEEEVEPDEQDNYARKLPELAEWMHRASTRRPEDNELVRKSDEERLWGDDDDATEIDNDFYENDEPVTESGPPFKSFDEIIRRFTEDEPKRGYREVEARLERGLYGNPKIYTGRGAKSHRGHNFIGANLPGKIFYHRSRNGFSTLEGRLGPIEDYMDDEDEIHRQNLVEGEGEFETSTPTQTTTKHPNTKMTPTTIPTTPTPKTTTTTTTKPTTTTTKPTTTTTTKPTTTTTTMKPTTTTTTTTMKPTTTTTMKPTTTTTTTTTTKPTTTTTKQQQLVESPRKRPVQDTGVNGVGGSDGPESIEQFSPGYEVNDEQEAESKHSAHKQHSHNSHSPHSDGPKKHLGRAGASHSSKAAFNFAKDAARKNVKHVEEEGKCDRPRARLIPVRDIYLDSTASYMPRCAMLHRCSDDTGCCPERHTCKPHTTEMVELYFIVTDMGSSERLHSVYDKLSFENHTECMCVLKNDSMQSDMRPLERSARFYPVLQNVVRPSPRCRCPTQFTPSITGDGKCECSCIEQDQDCLKLQGGKGYLSLHDRLCIMNEQCTAPQCKFGDFITHQGRCPLKKDAWLLNNSSLRQRSISYHRQSRS